MKSTTTVIKANDGLALNNFIWMPDNDSDLKAILLLVHGSVEHAKRYVSFAKFLTENGIGIYAFDLRGHGKTTDSNSPEFAHIPYKIGWDLLLNDITVVHNTIKIDYPNLPRFLFGHSMGSFLVRDYISNRSSDFNGLILSGTTYGNAIEIKLLMNVAKLMTLMYKPIHKSKFLHDQIYNKLNKSIKNPETNVDFISTDKKEVQKYLADELSGRTISIGYAYEMGKGLLRTRKKEAINKIPKSLPILMISGKDDPVGGKEGKEVVALYNNYKDAGLTNVSLKLYENARHEILNDVSRDEVMNDIFTWMNENLSLD